MISYEVYKVLHLFTLFILCSSFGVILSQSNWADNKRFKTSLFIVSFLVFVAGMGLVARVGIKHGQSFPHWIILKMLMWVIVNILLVLIFKSKEQKVKMIYGFFFLMSLLISATTAIFKFNI
jgi:uncharacterized membrane protein SirB2